MSEPKAYEVVKTYKGLEFCKHGKIIDCWQCAAECRAERDTALARVAELEGIIRDAPHDNFCDVFDVPCEEYECTCWKDRATK